MLISLHGFRGFGQWFIFQDRKIIERWKKRAHPHGIQEEERGEKPKARGQGPI